MPIIGRPFNRRSIVHSQNGVKRETLGRRRFFDEFFSYEVTLERERRDSHISSERGLSLLCRQDPPAPITILYPDHPSPTRTTCLVPRFVESAYWYCAPAMTRTRCFTVPRMSAS